MGSAGQPIGVGGGESWPWSPYRSDRSILSFEEHSRVMGRVAALEIGDWG